MGASPSKDDREETVSKNASKEPMQYDSETVTSYVSGKDEEESAILALSPDNMSTAGKGNHKIHNIAASRGANGNNGNHVNGKKNGIGGLQSRVDRQLAAVLAERRDDIALSQANKNKADDQVQVNLAMADLMAYLQVVANNSNNLPLTRRDDPELNRMVSSLTTEEYARKSAAFIPADVRVIGATFTKYGRVWDLPTGEEYNPTDGAQEPGRSYGGACCNSFLKVLYDGANEAADAAQTMEAAEALFDDDEDDSIISNVNLNGNRTFASIDMNDHSNPSTITWANLLRKMKAEMREIEYAQVPTLTSSRKFDVNQPFSFVPTTFNAATGKKRSLLIGCNYPDSDGAQLKASHDDIRSMKDYIVNVHGFTEESDLMTILLDDDQHKQPTHQNITDAFKALSEESLPGDVVFIQFSGHGGRILDSPVDSEAESYDEVIVPTDFATNGLIRDTLAFKTLLAPMRYGVTVTILIDACDTGAVFDLPYAWSTRSDRPDSLANMTLNEDFSFVRFLKVVKTLYEASTFTQLGKTVGSALTQPPTPGGDNDDDEDETVGGTVLEDDQTLNITDKAQNQSSLMNLLTSCASPSNGRESSNKERKDRKLDRDMTTVDTRDTRAPSSILEQVMNCTYAHGDDPYSDDDTYHTKDDRSYDEHTLDDSTYDSMTEDGYESSRRSRGRTRRRRRN